MDEQKSRTEQIVEAFLAADDLASQSNVFPANTPEYGHHRVDVINYQLSQMDTKTLMTRANFGKRGLAFITKITRDRAK